MAGRQAAGARRRNGREANGAAPAVADLAHARELLARADRLVVLGTLAAGVAHEIRNPLVSVRTFLELLPERLDDEEFRTGFRTLALGEIDRICDLLNDLLAFTRPTPAEPDASDPSAVVLQTVRLLEPEARKRGVALDLDCGEGVPAVPVEAGRLKQVVMNVLLNALEACEERGAVDVRTRAGRAGTCGVIEIADTGAGIPPHLAPRIFDAFVTSKPAGSGLGLYVAHRIVSEHGGAIAARSRPGGGTVFAITLPAATAACDADAG